MKGQLIRVSGNNLTFQTFMRHQITLPVKKDFVDVAWGNFEVNTKPLTEDDKEQIWKEHVINNSHYTCHTSEAIKLLLKLQE